MSILFGGGRNQIINQGNMIANIRLQTSAFGLPIPIVYGKTRIATNLIWYGDFKAIPQVTSQSSGGGGGKGGGGGGATLNITYTYTAAVELAICEGPISAIIRMWKGVALTSPAEEGISIFLGSYAQNPWSYLTTNHSGQDLAYRGLAYGADSAYLLGSNAELPNNSFEVTGIAPYGTGGQSGKNFTVNSSPKTFTVQTVAAPTYNPYSLAQQIYTGVFSYGSYFVSPSLTQPITYLPDFMANGHGFGNGDVIRLTTSGTLPAPFATGTDYFVVGKTTNTFELAAILGGPPIFPSTTGSGAHTATAFYPDFNSVAHGYANGTTVLLSTSGILPNGLSAGLYYTAAITTNTFQLAPDVNAASITPRTAGTGVQTSTLNIADANPKDILNDYLTNVNYGVGFPSNEIGDLTQWSNYCVANNLFLSPAYVAQEAAADAIIRLCAATNSAPFFSEGKLKIVPYGDQNITANGVTFTASVTPIYSLGDDSFANESQPIVCARSRGADAFNSLQLKYFDRNNQYAESVAEAKDQSNIEQFALRPQSPITLHEICDSLIAKTVSYLILQRVLYVRNVYKFKLPINYILLEPMDVISVTDTTLGLNATPLRITSISEDASNSLSIEAEEFPTNVSTAALYGQQAGVGFNPNYNANPGPMNAPIIFDSPGNMTVTGFELWMALSGGVTWGGAQIYVSADNVNFKQVGTVYGNARYGQLTANFSSSADPDTTNTCAVDLTASQGGLTSGTQADADDSNTLCYVDDELISYQDAILTAQYKYDLKTYLRRGRFNSIISAHFTGEPFIRLDGNIFKYPYDPTIFQNGSIVYLKFVGFNKYGGALQSLADVPTYTFVIGSSITNPANVTGFTASQSGNVVLFQWDLLNAPNIAGYEIRYQPITLTPSWASANPITQVTRGTQVTTAKVPPGTWTFLIAARDDSQKYSLTPATTNLAVTSAGNIILSGTNLFPDWLGCTLTNLLKHWSGELVPESTLQANAMTNAELFEQFVPYPTANCACEAPQIDIGMDTNVRIFATITAHLGRGVSIGEIHPDLQVDYKTNAGSFLGYQAWTIGTVLARYIKQKIVFAPVDGNGYVTGFTPTVDALPVQETGTNIVIAAGGQHVSFPIPYHQQPNVQVTALSTGLLATAQNISLIGFDTNIVNLAGTDVGGNENWIATGV